MFATLPDGVQPPAEEGFVVPSPESVFQVNTVYRFAHRPLSNNTVVSDGSMADLVYRLSPNAPPGFVANVDTGWLGGIGI